MDDEPMTPIEDFEHTLLLVGFSLGAHALRSLGMAGLIDEPTRAVIRGHLEMLQEKIEAMPEDDRDFFEGYLDVLTAVLPPTKGGGGSQAAE
jgi:hypothetical protein